METFGLLLILLAYSVGSPVTENLSTSFSSDRSSEIGNPQQREQDDAKSQTQDESLMKLVENIDCRLRTKLDTLGTKINNVNHNMETMKKKLDLLSINGNLVNQEIVDVEAGVNDKLEKMEESLRNRIDDVEKGVIAKMDAHRNGVNDSKIFCLFKDSTAVPSSGGQDETFIELSSVPPPAFITWSKYMATNIGRRFLHFWKFLKE